MMKCLFLCLFTILAGSDSLQAQQHLFTSTDGKTLIAEVQSATVDVVTLKLENGSAATPPLTRLSEPDRAFITEWRKAHPEDIRYYFVTEWSSERLDNKRFNNRGSVVQTLKQQWVAHLKILNRSSQAVDNLEVRYQLHYLSVDRKAKVLEHVSGTKTIPLIKSNETLTVDSDPLELEVTQLMAGWTWGDGTKNKEKDDIKGVVVTLYHNGKQVHEFVSRGVTKAEDSSGTATSSAARSKTEK